MPQYQYQCRDCKHITDKFMSIKEARQVVTCEKCGKDAFKILSAGAFTVLGHNAKNGYHCTSKG